jgi:gamma-polyglutamate biosynthesis protein CapC
MTGDLVMLSLSLGLVASLTLSELIGVVAGGLVVPGYLALGLDQPLTAVVTIATGLATLALVQLAGRFTFLYGRRRTTLLMLTGFALAAVVRMISPLSIMVGGVEFGVVGYIVPGLIALWVDRQGALPTLCTLVTTSVIVRLILMLITGGEAPL